MVRSAEIEVDAKIHTVVQRRSSEYRRAHMLARQAPFVVAAASRDWVHPDESALPGLDAQVASRLRLNYWDACSDDD